MLSFRRLLPGHLRYIRPQAVQSAELSELLSEENRQALATGVCLSAWADHACLAAAGIIPMWRGRAQAWALISAEVGPYMTPLVRKMRYVLDNHNVARIEMQVRSDFIEGNRMAMMLGFHAEAFNCPAYFPDGAAANMYVRLRG